MSFLMTTYRGRGYYDTIHLDDNQNILITMCILGQWSDMIEMKNITSWTSDYVGSR